MDLKRFPHLNTIEGKFESLILELVDAGPIIPDHLVDTFRLLVGDYSTAVNSALKAYADIDYLATPKHKVEAKAVIKYSYDFLDLIIKILRNLSEAPELTPIVEQDLQLLEEFHAEKYRLLETNYLDHAQQELDLFYNPDIRAQLDADLAKRIEGKSRR